MDASNYNDVVSAQGHKYHYYHTKPTQDKPTIFFLHGFPSTSWDWHHQVTHFATLGFGIIVPDLLGYGGTDKPADPIHYRTTSMANDLVDILGAVAIQKVIVVAHDWGCGLASTFIVQSPERVAAIAFLAVGFTPPNPDFDYHTMLSRVKAVFGTDLFGYWDFFEKEDAASVIEGNIDSFHSALFAEDAAIMGQVVAPLGKYREFIESGRVVPLASYLTPEEIKAHKSVLLQGGLTGPLNWYKARVRKLDIEDVKAIPVESYHIHVPAFHAAALRDEVCIPALAQPALQQYAKNRTVKEFETGHWIQLEAPGELNRDLEEWMSKL